MKQGFYIVVFLFFCASAIAQNNELFNKGNELYNDGKYAEAVDSYSSILETEKHSAELYFNLGNAHYKLNNIAPSIFYFEKALQLKPNDEDIKNNLAYAKNMTIDAIDVIPEVGFSKFIKRITNSFSFDTWAKIAILFSIIYVLLVLAYYLSYTTVKKRFAFVVSVICLLLLSLSLTLAFHKFKLDKNENPAIVFAQEAQIKTEPNLRSEEAFKLHEGTKVQVLDTINNWKKVKLSDGKVGWILSKDIKLLSNK